MNETYSCHPSSFISISGCSETETITDQFSQVAPPVLNPNHYDDISFACGAGGKASDIVDEFSRLITCENYSQLKKNLYSQKPGKACLATISCEMLEAKGLIRLSERDFKQIQNNYSKVDTIYTCSGCTLSEYNTVQKILNDTSSTVKTEAGWWFESMFGKNITAQ